MTRALFFELVATLIWIFSTFPKHLVSVRIELINNTLKKEISIKLKPV
jgi:uncharacterized membrane protein SpoIIM required for sporulation